MGRRSPIARLQGTSWNGCRGQAPPAARASTAPTSVYVVGSCLQGAARNGRRCRGRTGRLGFRLRRRATPACVTVAVAWPRRPPGLPSPPLGYARAHLHRFGPSPCASPPPWASHACPHTLPRPSRVRPGDAARRGHRPKGRRLLERGEKGGGKREEIRGKGEGTNR